MSKQIIIVTSVLILGIAGLLRLTQLTANPPLTDFRRAEVPLPALTLERIFESDHSWTATLSAEKKVVMIATGDVLTARSVNAKNTRLNDFTWPFHHTAEVLRAADLTFINLETPLIPDCPVKTDGMIFCGDPRNVSGLVFAGVDVVNLANNHMGNYGEAGVTSTIEALNQASIASTGITGPTYLPVKDLVFAFLGYNEIDRQPGVPYPSDELIRSEIQAAQQQADVVVVQFHWGNEYTHQPSRNQQRLAHLAIDAGADVVLGNHPHWWQPLEIYQDKFIMYSHGNFVFDQMWSWETRQGLAGKYTWYDGKLVDVEFLPVLIHDYGQPRWMEGDQQVQLLNNLRNFRP